MHARIYCPTLVTNMCDLAKGLKLKPITYEGDTPPSPRAYCVPHYFGLAYCVPHYFGLPYCVPHHLGLAYCVPPFLGLAYCVPFYNKHNHFGVSIYINKIKWQYIA